MIVLKLSDKYKLIKIKYENSRNLRAFEKRCYLFITVEIYLCYLFIRLKIRDNHFFDKDTSKNKKCLKTNL